MQSPYFTPPRRASSYLAAPSPPETPFGPSRRLPTNRRARQADIQGSDEESTRPLRRSKRLCDADKGRAALPPTPQSIVKAPAARKRPNVGVKRPKPQVKQPAIDVEGLGNLMMADDLALGRIVPAATDAVAERSHLPKVVLAQDKLRHDPWKLLVMTTLLNKTAGRAVRPIFEVLLRRYPTPQALSEASVPDLANLLFPLGLFNQRASSLIRFSSQYLSLQWPTATSPGTLPLPDPDANGRTRYALNTPMPEMEKPDVNVFYGSGVYASDSFRIYSPLLPGVGGPSREGEWLEKRKRAEGRCGAARAAEAGKDQSSAGMMDDLGQERGEPSIEEVDDALSDEEDVGPEEWRTVIAGDKELRRYLRWRWAIEGIEYDYTRGPIIRRERDKQRLTWLIDM